MEVQDKPTEVGIKLNNILTALVLMVMSWVGYNINTMKDHIAVIRTDSAVQAVQLTYIADRLDRHINNKDAHK